MITTETNPQETNTVAHQHSGVKRTNEELGELERATPTKRTQGRHVAWAKKNEMHLLPNNRKLFKDYRDEDIWYTRNDYEDFLIDRMRTIECLRNSGGDEKALDKESRCSRGLEPFQSPDVHDKLTSDRSFHRTTILIEQIRQSLYGMKNPEGFRMMVGPQSEIAARRARELAAMDEHDVYGRVRRRGSLLSSPPSKCRGILQKSTLEKDASASDYSSIALAERIRQLQESNARRLMEIYSQPGYNPFRFPIRRDSLIGNSSMVGGAFNLSNRFPIRRDSLTLISSNSRL